MGRTDSSASGVRKERQRSSVKVSQTEELKKNILSTATLPSYSPPCTPPMKREQSRFPAPGAGGVPEEPIPDLESEQKYLKFKTSIYKSTPYVHVDEALGPKEEEVLREKVPFLVCKDLDEYLRLGAKRTFIRDCQVLIDIIRDHPEFGCLYLRRVGSPSRIDYNPYHFVVCNYDDVDKTHFCTITPIGFTEFSPEELTYLTLEQLETDYRRYVKLKTLSFFKQYYLSKYLKTWYAGLRKKRWTDLRDQLSRSLETRKSVVDEELLQKEAERKARRKEAETPLLIDIPSLSDVWRKAERWKEEQFLSDLEYEETFVKLLKSQSVERKELEEEAMKITSADLYRTAPEKTVITDYSMIMW